MICFIVLKSTKGGDYDRVFYEDNFLFTFQKWIEVNIRRTETIQELKTLWHFYLARCQKQLSPIQRRWEDRNTNEVNLCSKWSFFLSKQLGTILPVAVSPIYS